MAHHYAGGQPTEVEVEKSDFPEPDFDSVSVPGPETEYEINFNVDLKQLMHEGELVDAAVCAGIPVFEEVMSEYQDSSYLEVFLGYAESDWTAEEMWQNTNMERNEIYSITEELEDDQGLIRTDFGDVELTGRGRNLYETLTYLSDQR